MSMKYIWSKIEKKKPKKNRDTTIEYLAYSQCLKEAIDWRKILIKEEVTEAHISQPANRKTNDKRWLRTNVDIQLH